MRIFSLCLLLLGACAGASSSPGAAAAGPAPVPVAIKCTAGAALMPFVEAAAKELPAQAPGVGVELEEARSSAAIQKLIEGAIEVAFISRPVRSSELGEAAKVGRTLHMVVVAAEAVAVVVHPQNPLRDISKEQLNALFFAATLRDWAELTDGKKSGPIHVIAVNPKTSGTGDLFVNSIAGDAKPEYVAGALIVDYSDDTVAKVAADPNAISFSGMGNVDERVSNLTINRVAPTEKAILDTSYILNRKLFAVTSGPPKGGSRELVKFLLSDRGQHIARATGVTPIALD